MVPLQPFSWAASEDKPGVNLLNNLSEQTIRHIKTTVEAVKQQGDILNNLSEQTIRHIKTTVEAVEQQGDIVLASIHWGSNWGYEIPAQQMEFAHKLIDEAGVDVIHGHSSHHVKGIEVYKGKIIIYGSGDFINDYEGIGGYEDYRSDLALMYFMSVDPANGKLDSLQMIPIQIKHFKANRASLADARWLREILNREGKKLGTRVEFNHENTLTLKWD
jgi:poly-gamma-glutamate synthesis protein (capsule biosynthesis protein)